MKPYGHDFPEGTEAIVTTRSGIEFRAVWSLAPGIGFWWMPVESVEGLQSYFLDPEVSIELVNQD